VADARPPLVPLLDALNDVAGWLAAEHVRGAVIGGVAASLLGRPRLTRDVDVLVSVAESRWNEFLAGATQFGLVPRHPDAIAFAHTARVLLMRHEPSTVDVDVVLGALPFEEEILARATTIHIDGIPITLASAEDIVILKAVAGRPRDLGDIESVLAANPTLDHVRVRRWVREFSTALGRPDIYKTMEKLLPRPRRKSVKKKKQAPKHK